MTDRPLRLMFQDEARFGLIGDPRRCWAPFPVRPLVTIEIVQQFSYAYVALSPHDGTLDALILPHVGGVCMEIFLQELGSRHNQENVLLVLDGAGWHRSRQLRVPAAHGLVGLGHVEGQGGVTSGRGKNIFTMSCFKASPASRIDWRSRCVPMNKTQGRSFH